MATCSECGTEFNVDEARAQYNAAFNGIDYDEETGGEKCAGCAEAETQSYMDTGRAIDMMNGDEDYDDDFVQRHL